MKILIFSHGTFWGGAEKALMDLVDHLSLEHQVAILFPYYHGEMVEICRAKGLEIGFMPLGLSLPNPANFLLDFYRLDLEAYLAQFRNSKFDFVIANTLATLQGVLIANMLNVPCLVYAHEYLIPKEGLSPHGCSAQYYLQMYMKGADHILCASQYIRSSFEPSDAEKLSVLYPFSPYQEPLLKTATHDGVSLLVIGGKLIRKNTHFALIVLKALRLRGINADLHIVGSDGDGTFKLNQQRNLRQENHVYISEHHPNPFTIGGTKKINLICALNEPFGLTMTESLYSGIPVVSSKCGGPEEVLPKDFLYEKNNLDECVRTIENIVNNYDYYSTISKKLYDDFIKNTNNLELRRQTINTAIEATVHNFKNKSSNQLNFDVNHFKNILDLPISFEDIISNIALVSQQTSNPLTIADISSLISLEQQSPGNSVLRDIAQFDVVPFAHSKNMDQLYAAGLGLAIELATHVNGINKLRMLAYILLVLEERQSLASSKLKILFLGDGLGIDSIKIAQCGFDIDYLDYENSLMSKCANLNIHAARKINSKININIVDKLSQKYDAIVCLEVIEHVSNPSDFIKFISDSLNSEGIVLISECFDGVYDIWPTHLYVNEEFSASIELLMAPYFYLEDINIDPFGKPYFFRKKQSNILKNTVYPLFSKSSLVGSFIQLKNKIGY